MYYMYYMDLYGAYDVYGICGEDGISGSSARCAKILRQGPGGYDTLQHRLDAVATIMELLGLQDFSVTISLGMVENTPLYTKGIKRGW